MTRVLLWLLVLTLAALDGAFLQSHDYWRAVVLVVVMVCMFFARSEFTETNR